MLDRNWIGGDISSDAIRITKKRIRMLNKISDIELSSLVLSSDELKKVRENVHKSLKVFLCHAKEDKQRVRVLYNSLLTSGVQPWLDEVDILPGQDWKLEIEKAVRLSDAVIVCLSKDAVRKTGYVQKEIRYALDIADEYPEGKIFIIPARLEKCDVPHRLSDKHWVDLFADDGYERLVKSLTSIAQE